MVNDVVVVIRSVGERTENACFKIAKSQVGSDQAVYLVKNKPFAEAHLESMRLAVEHNAKWSILLDADILLDEEGIQQMVAEAEKISHPFYLFNFRILDYGFNGPSYGVHLYATEQLKRAFRFENEIRDVQRPETYLSKLMGNMGVPSIGTTSLVGLHGYEQFYSDLYRTAFVRAVKYSIYQDYFMKLYRDRYEDENNPTFDFRIMFWGIIDGMIFQRSHENAPLVKPFYDEKISGIFDLLHLDEKPEFAYHSFSVRQVIQNHISNSAYQSIADKLCPPQTFSVEVPDHSLRKKFRQFYGTCYRFIRNIKRHLLSSKQ